MKRTTSFEIANSLPNIRQLDVLNGKKYYESSFTLINERLTKVFPIYKLKEISSGLSSVAKVLILAFETFWVGAQRQLILTKIFPGFSRSYHGNAGMVSWITLWQIHFSPLFLLLFLFISTIKWLLNCTWTLLNNINIGFWKSCK